jgi:serine/threonine protein kinase
LLLGPYEIQSLLGSGGMGEVYRAIDTRLQRPVAIKVLSEELTSSSIAMERFQREMRTASLLNHPHICTIYDVGLTQPQFIAMELLEGESLQHRLRKGPLDLSALLAIAFATTEGLEAAHAHGVIHRDVKPANIFLTAHGPKLLDFGLAKAGAAAIPDVVSNEQTRPAEALRTASGVTLGTVAYMSPEQLRGADVDARTDIFSLGLVLYEMATGRPAFTGTTAAALSGAILYEQPPPPSDIVGELPQRLNDIILKAIEKDRDDRYQTAADLRADLRRVKREMESQTAHPTSAASAVAPHLRPGTRTPSRVRSARTLIVGACLIIAAIWGLDFYFRSMLAPGRETPPLSLESVQIARLTTTGDAERAAIAPDGNYVVYVRRLKGEDSLHLRQTASAATAEIIKAEPNVGLYGVTVSPDGAFVDYVRRLPAQPFELWRVPFLGGTPRRLLVGVTSPIGWSRDGRRFAFIRADATLGTTSIVIVNAADSAERTLAERRRPAQFVSLMIAARPSVAPAWSPDGRTLAVAGAGGGADPSQGDVSFLDIETGTPKTFPLPSNKIRGLVWLNDTTLLLNVAASEGGPVQLHRLSYPSGEVSPLTRDLTDYDGLSLAADGRTVVCTRRERRTELSLVDTAGTNSMQGPVMPGAKTLNWAADRVLYGAWTWQPGNTPLEQLPGAEDTTASSDGRTFVFVRANGLWKADADGGRPTQLVAGEGWNPIFTADDRAVIFISSRTGRQSLWIVSIHGGEPRQLADVYAAAPGADISPDGKSIVFGSHHLDNRNVALICDLPDCTARRILPGLGTNRLRWTPDGRAITYIESGAQTNLWAVPVEGGKPRQLTHFADRVIVDFDWAANGERLVVARVIDTNDIVVMKSVGRE